MELRDAKGIIGFILFLGFLWIYPFMRSTTKWDETIIIISIGFLSFVAIFYSFIIKREINEKRERLLLYKWKEKLPILIEKISHLNRETKGNKKPKYDELLNESISINEILEEISILRSETNINEIITKTVLSLLFAIAFIFSDMVTSITYQDMNILMFGGFVLFVYSFYKIFDLVTSWTMIIGRDA